ncbi:MAG: D-alanine--D-alanine ligase [Propionibacteriaceae bacterium]|nr:D-alanine--D-alanine ligase [Propionibacteriaceae bacterium]
MKISVVVLFGGKSVEHEVSIISAVQAMAAMDPDKYEIHPVYITKDNAMYTSEALKDIGVYTDIPSLLKATPRASFEVEGTKTYLVSQKSGLFSKPTKALIDVAFPIVHGTNVEDGALQGFLETINLPYVGPNVLASAVGMDKFVMKVMLDHGGFPVLKGLRFHRSQADSVGADVEDAFDYPVIVKPVNLGSSVGIGKASDADELRQCVDEAFAYSRYILVEPAIVNLREINCSVVGDAGGAEASECEEPIMTDAILSYADKYSGGSKGAKSSPGSKAADSSKGGKSGMASLKRKIPADITDEQREKIRTLAVDAFRYLDLNGVTRVDFLMDANTGEVWINEVNTIPGSLAFYLWVPVGVSYPQLLDRLVSLSLKRAREAEDVTYTFDTNILANARLGAKGSKG